MYKIIFTHSTGVKFIEIHDSHIYEQVKLLVEEARDSHKKWLTINFTFTDAKKSMSINMEHIIAIEYEEQQHE